MSAQRPLLFLDIDGVLNHRSFYDSWTRETGGEPICSECVARLNEITVATGARIVVSSSWRDRRGTWIRRVLKNHGVVAPVVGVTPRIRVPGGPFVERGAEIAEWMRVNGVPDRNVVIVDDDDDMGWLIHRLVRTSWETGLTDDHVAAAVALLGGRS